MGKPTVIAHFDENGSLNYFATSGVDLFIVDERAPSDRVYHYTTRTSRKVCARILGDDPIGSKDDDRHEAIEARVVAGQEGRPHLSAVEDDV